MQDLYSGFKKVSEDDNKAILEHENGHRLSIAKSGLSKKHLHGLSKLPLHQANGSQEELMTPLEQPVENVPEDTTSMTKKVGRFLGENVVKQMLEGVAEGVSEPYRAGRQLGETAAQAVSDVAPVFKEPAKQIYKTAGELGSGVAEGVKGQPIEPMPQAQQDLTDETVPEEQLMTLGQPEAPTTLQQSPVLPRTPQQLEQPQAQIAPNVEKPAPRDLLDIAADSSLPESQRMEALMQHDLELQRQMKNADDEWLNIVKTQKEYDPNRIYSNMSTGQKIQQAIGLLLGGLGAGLTGGENPVMALINKTIEQDIDAQKQERADKFNLYKMHLARLGDERAATLQTLNNLQSLTKSKMEDLLNKKGIGPMGQKTLQAATLALDASMAKNRFEISSMESQKQYKNRLAKGEITEIPDESDPNLAKSYRVQIVDPQGNVQTVKRYARSDASATKAQDLSNKVQRAEQAIRNIGLFNTAEGRALFGEAKATKQQLYTEALSAMAELQTGGSTDRNIKAIKEGVPVPGAVQLGESDAKVRAALQTIQSFKKTLENY